MGATRHLLLQFGTVNTSMCEPAVPSSQHGMVWEPVVQQAGDSPQPEWYAGFSAIKPLLQQELTFTDSILVLSGPQASSLHEDLYGSGYRGLTAVHSSSQLIQSWRQKQAASNKPTLKYQAAEIAEGLAFEHLPYSAIIDQGTLDGLLCKEDGTQEAEAALVNVWSNLKSPGTFILFTHGPPSLRMALLSKQAWSSISVRAILPGTATAQGGSQSLQLVRLEAGAVPPASATYVYVCKKPYV